MRRSRFVITAASLVVAAMPISELYAACTYSPTIGGEWMYCDNGTCWSRSLWTSDGQLVPGSTSSGCRNEA